MNTNHGNRDLYLVVGPFRFSVSLSFAKTSFSFISDPGGGSSLAEQMGVRFLGDIPIDPKIAQSMDSGLNLLQTQTSSHVTDVVDKMTESMSSLYD